MSGRKAASMRRTNLLLAGVLAGLMAASSVFAADPAGPSFGNNKYLTTIDNVDGEPDVDDYVADLVEGEQLRVTVSTKKRTGLTPGLQVIDPDGVDRTPELKVKKKGLVKSFKKLLIDKTGTWAVRIIGSVTLKKEAMGFGDVTLMAMIGAFVGWQAFLLIFFIAPFAGLVIGLAQWLLNRDHEIPYGPFLCLGTIVVIFQWAAIWNEFWTMFYFAWLVPAIIGGCLVAMFIMLGSYRMILQKLGRWN